VRKIYLQPPYRYFVIAFSLSLYLVLIIVFLLCLNYVFLGEGKEVSYPIRLGLILFSLLLVIFIEFLFWLFGLRSYPLYVSEDSSFVRIVYLLPLRNKKYGADKVELQNGSKQGVAYVIRKKKNMRTIFTLRFPFFSKD